MPGSFPQRPLACLCLAFLVVLAFLCVAVVAGVVGSSTWSPAVFRPMSSSATVLARVVVCIARVACVVRAISFLVLVFAFALSLTFLERVDLHLVVFIRTLFHFQLTRLDLLHSFPGAYLLCIRRHASAPLDSSTDRTRVRTLPFVVKANE